MNQFKLNLQKPGKYMQFLLNVDNVDDFSHIEY